MKSSVGQSPRCKIWGGKSEHPLTLSEKRIAANSRALSEKSERDGKCNRKYTASRYSGVRVKSCGKSARLAIVK